MAFIDKITPPFLRRLDAYLRVNHSWIWATKIHIHIYLAILLGAFFSIVGLLYFIDIKEVPDRQDVNGFFYLLFVPAALFSLLMLYNMALFNTDKSAGYRFRYQEFFQFILYFLTFSLPLLIIVPPVMILNERIDRLVSDDQFELDKKYFDEGELFFPHGNSHEYYYFPSDRIYLKETTPDKNGNIGIEDYPNYGDEYDYEPEYDYEDEEDPELRARDSVRREKLNEWDDMKDSVFWHKGVFAYSRPKLYFYRDRVWKNNDYDDNSFSSDENIRRSRVRDSIFRLYLSHVNITRDPQLAAKNIAEVSKLMKLYYKDTAIDEKQILNDFIQVNYGKDGFSKDYLNRGFVKVQENIDNIQQAKFRSIDAWEPGVYGVLGMFIFCLSILFYIFKNVHWRQFLLAAALTALIMTIFAIIEIIFFRFRGGFINLMGIIVPIIFLVCSVRGFYIKRFSWILNQLNIMLNVILPFLPLIILMYLDNYQSIFTIDYFDKYKEYYIDVHGEKDWRYNDEYNELVSRIWAITFWAGILGYLFIWNSYLKALYLRYWFLPKTK